MSRRAPLLVLLVLLGCRPAAETEEVEAQRPAPPTAAEAHEHAGEAELVIGPDMLHDLRLTTAVAESRTGGEGLTALGELQVDQDAYAEVGAPVAARVVRMLAAPGDVVDAGQPLVEIESVELGKARAEYLSARARAELARATLARKRALAAERIAPRRELQAAEAELAAADAMQRAAEATLRALGTSPQELNAGGDADARLILRTPVAGIVIERTGARGQMADPAQPLFRIADLSRLWLIAHAFERDALRIRRGAAARVTFPALPGRTFPGTVTLVGRQVDVGSRTIPVRIDVPNADGLLRPGMSASAWVPIDDARQEIVTVPVAALQRVRGGWAVFVPQGAQAFEIRPVGRGRDLGGEVEIVSGLRAGETVVVDGAFLLRAEAEKAGSEGGHDH